MRLPVQKGKKIKVAVAIGAIVRNNATLAIFDQFSVNVHGTRLYVELKASRSS